MTREKDTTAAILAWIMISFVLVFIVIQEVLVTLIIVQAVLSIIIFVYIFITIKTDKHLIKSRRLRPCLSEGLAWSVTATFWALALVVSGNLMMGEKGGSYFVDLASPAMRSDLPLIASFQAIFNVTDFFRLAGKELAFFFVDVFVLIFCTAYFRDKGYLKHTANSDSIVFIITAVMVFFADAVVAFSLSGFATYNLFDIATGIAAQGYQRIISLIVFVQDNGLSPRAYWDHIATQIYAGRGNLLFLMKSMPIILLILAITNLRPKPQHNAHITERRNPHITRTMVLFSLYPFALLVVLGFRIILHAFDPPTQAEMDAIWYLLVPYKILVLPVLMLAWCIVLFGPMNVTHRMIEFSKNRS